MRFIRTITTTAAALAVALAVTGCTGADTTAPTAGSATATAVPASAAATTADGTQSPAISPTPSAATPTGTAASPSATPSPARLAQAQDANTGSAGTALAALQDLPVKGRAPKTGYDREEFGPAWADTDRNGCDTRNDILARDLRSETFKPGTGDCVVATGVLDDPYTATEIHFTRGQDTSTAVQIDHVVALSDAWQKGAQQLSAAQRTAFANDPLNLLAVDGPANAQKGDGDAATWLPANRSFRCDYVARQIAVKAEYQLWVTAAERDAMTGVLTDCPDQVLPGAGTAAPAPRAPERQAPKVPAPAPAPKTPAPAPAPKTKAPQPASTDPDFGTCKAAKAAGHGPYVRGVDAEYAWYRDADSDGIVCE